MKRLLTLSLVTIGAAALASATTITLTCPTAGGSGGTGTAVTTCNVAGGPVGYSTLDSIVLTFKFDANFGIGAGSVLENFDTDALGAGDAFGGALDHPADQLVTDQVRGIVGTLTLLNPTLTQVNTALGGLQIQDNWSQGQGSFNSSAFSFQVDVNYSTAQSGVPEPATLGLMGSGLLGLGFLARRRRS